MEKMMKAVAILKHSLSLYKQQFLKIFTLGFFFSCACTLAILALIYSDFSVLDVITFQDFMNFDCNDRIALAIEQKKHFPYMSRWTLMILSIATMSPLFIRIFYIVLLGGINFFTIGFIRSLCMIYDNKMTTLQDLFFSYKAVVRAICIVITFGCLLATVFIMGKMIFVDYLQVNFDIFISFYSVYALLNIPVFFVAMYKAITTQEPWVAIIPSSFVIVRNSKLLIMIMFFILVLMHVISANVLYYIFHSYCLLNRLIGSSFLQNIFIMPVTIFVLYGTYNEVCNKR